MSDLLLKAELQKLAAVLNVSVAELGFLAHLDVPALRELRQATAAAIFDRHARGFRKLAESSRLLPNKLVAVISEKVIPPFLSAQVTGLLEPEDAVDVARRLPVAYQADICLVMDPRRAAPVLQAMPVDNVVNVAMELLRRREFMTMARFVDTLIDSQILAVSRRMQAEGLLQVGFFVEEDKRLDQLIGLLSDEQLAEILPVAAGEDGALWPQVLSLVERLGDQQRKRLAGLWHHATPAMLASFSQALIERDLWRDAVPLLASLDDGAQEIIASSLVSHADAEPPPGLLAALPDGLRRKIELALKS